MRLLIYILIAVAVFFGLTRIGPVHRYLADIKSVVQTDTQQQQLIHLDRRSVLMKTALLNVLQANPSIVQVRMAVIHTGMTQQGNIVWQWDRVGIVAAPSFNPADQPVLSNNFSLTEWSGFLGTLINGRCVFVQVADLSDEDMKNRLTQEKIVAFAACPILNAHGQLSGALFGNWSSLDSVPSNQEPVMQSLQASADMIGARMRLGFN
jgi:hypothetical protein